jgi:MFS family permease
MLLLLVSAALGFALGLTFMGSVTLVDRVCPPAKRGEILAGFYSAGYLALSVPTVGVALASEQIGLTAAGIGFASLLAVAVAFLYWGTYRTPTPPGGGGRPRESRPSQDPGSTSGGGGPSGTTM